MAPAADAVVAGTTAGLAWLRLPGLEPARFEAVGAAFDVAIAPDGARLAHAILTPDGAERTVLRSADAAPVAELDGLGPAFSPDGATLATGTSGYAEQARSWLWRAADGAPLAELAGGDPEFSPDGRYLATVELLYDTPSITRVYAADGARPLLELEARAPAFSRDSAMLAVAADGQIEVYALPDGALRTRVPTEDWSAAAFSDDGRELRIVSGADLIVWDLGADRELRRAAGVNRGELYPDQEPLFLPAGATVATFEPPLGDCPPAGVRFSSVADGAVLYEDDSSYSGDAAADGRLVALGYNSGVRVVDLASGADAERDLPAYEDVAFSPDGATMALSTALGSDENYQVGQVELWDVATGTRRGALLAAPDDFVFSLVGLRFSSDGARLSALARYGCIAAGFLKVLTWDVASGAIVSEIGDIPTQIDDSGVIAAGLGSVGFAPDGSVAAWRDDAGRLVVRNVSGQEWRYDDLEAPPTAVAFSSRGTALAVGDAAGGVSLLEVGGSPLRAIGRLGGEVAGVAFAADGERVTAVGAGEAAVWDRAGAELARLPVGDGAMAPALSADGTLLLAREPAGVGIYGLAGGGRLALADGGATGAALGPGQRLLATVRDGRAILWGIP
jgi:WD40 repeat protein